MLLFAGCVAATPTPSKEPLALVCNLDPFAPAAEQMQALADCITAIGTNFRRLADTMNYNSSTPFSKLESTLPPSSPPVPSVTHTTVRPSPAPIHRQRGATSSSATTPVHHQREISWLRRFVIGVGEMAEQHPLFTIAGGTVVGLAFIFGVVSLIQPFLDALEKRSVRGRILMVAMLILGVLVTAWALDTIITVLCE
ncbi:uncharacterized protein LOC129581109 [Paramacrobiotus metropolitanus]|uniref:uncharacterized protein LOC129581109 n=1 Tax=Paramacrobiotus metropolitanus TaxID=2943436 RepID=UPI0024463C3E|nr:uncharacterized protein LOC129581109 [Paramacrobiotus metropolitanus]